MPSAQSFVLRVVTVVAVACASLFAQHEAGKGFAVSVANDLPRGSVAARRFDLLLVSNGRAERALLRASRAVERALFPDASFPRRQVRRVTVRMAARNLTGAAVHSAAPGEYVVSLGPGLASSAPAAEACVAELVRRVERGGDVPDELRGARVLRLHLSRARVRLMTRADADAWAAGLRRSVAGSNSTGAGGGLVIYVGDMRWAVDDSTDDDDDDHARGRGLQGPSSSSGSFSPAAHLAAELARLLADLRLRATSRAWLLAAASYATFMRCQRSSLDVTWGLQPVSVPAGAGGGGLGLELGPRAATAR